MAAVYQCIIQFNWISIFIFVLQRWRSTMQRWVQVYSVCVCVFERKWPVVCLIIIISKHVFLSSGLLNEALLLTEDLGGDFVFPVTLGSMLTFSLSDFNELTGAAVITRLTLTSGYHPCRNGWNKTEWSFVCARRWTPKPATPSMSCRWSWTTCWMSWAPRFQTRKRVTLLLVHAESASERSAV